MLPTGILFKPFIALLPCGEGEYSTILLSAPEIPDLREQLPESRSSSEDSESVISMMPSSTVLSSVGME